MPIQHSWDLKINSSVIPNVLIKFECAVYVLISEIFTLETSTSRQVNTFWSLLSFNIETIIIFVQKHPFTIFCKMTARRIFSKLLENICTSVSFQGSYDYGSAMLLRQVSTTNDFGKFGNCFSALVLNISGCYFLPIRHLLKFWLYFSYHQRNESNYSNFILTNVIKANQLLKTCREVNLNDCFKYF